MDYKKVGTITLEYDPGDGSIRSDAFQAEFNNAFFNGRIEAESGTFSGKFTANAINVVKNLTIAGGSAAVTTITFRADVHKGEGGLGQDDGVFRSVIQQSYTVPSNDLSGGWLYISVQYHLTNTRHSDQDRKNIWPTSTRLLVNGVLQNFQIDNLPFGIWWDKIEHFKHDMLVQVPGPGTYLFDMQFAWGPMVTNIYPYFNDIYVRFDYVKK